jgi:hypothetical protein
MYYNDEVYFDGDGSIKCLWCYFWKSIHMGYVDRTVNPLVKHGVYVEGNMENIFEMIPINILNDPKIIENVFIGADYSSEEINDYTTLFKKFCGSFTWLHEEIPCIDPRIVEHEIKTYPNAKTI